MQGHLGRLSWGWGVSHAGHRWIRIEWRRQLYPGTVRFWEMQWR
jgi:hypothetical protein